MHVVWCWKNVKKKNDKEDVLKLVRLPAMNQISTVHILSKQVREKQALIKDRQRLVKHRRSVQLGIRAIFFGQGITTTSCVSSAKYFFVMHVQPWILYASVSNHSFSQFV